MILDSTASRFSLEANHKPARNSVRPPIRGGEQAAFQRVVVTVAAA